MKLDHKTVHLNGKTFDFNYRNDSVGDNGVIHQMFVSQDYRVDMWAQGRALAAYHDLHSATRPSLIIDAGANIGAAALYFLHEYSNAFVFAIEPDAENWKLLDINTSDFSQKHNFLGAAAERDGELQLVDPGLSDWGFRTQATEIEASGSSGGMRVKSISPRSIMSHVSCAHTNPLIFKVDIEGGEESLFSGDTTWMRSFPLIIVELHDWMLPFSGSSRSFVKALAQYEFDLVHRGENIFLFNRELLSEAQKIG